MKTPDNNVAEESVLDEVLNLVPEARKVGYLRLMNRFKHLSPDDEVLQIVLATGFLTLLIRQVPAEVAAEREKLDKLLLQQAPGAMAAERKELGKIFSSSVSQMQEAVRTTSQYHAQLESHLTKLPEAIVKGIAPEEIASRIGESMHQHLLNTGINETVNGMYTMAQQMKQAAGTMHEAAARISDNKQGVLPKLDAAVHGMEANLERATRRVLELSGELRSQADLGRPWAVVGALIVIILLILGLGFYIWPSKASQRGVPVDPSIVVQLPPSAVKVAPLLKAKEAEISQL